MASNAAVSTWTQNYRPYSVSSGNSSSSSHTLSVGGLYQAAADARMQAFAAARAANQQQLAARNSAIESDYTDNVRRTQVNARLTAAGNEEKLAALGLSGSSRYDAATSGYAASERLRMDNELKSDLTSLATTRQNALTAAADTASQADLQLLLQNAQATESASMSQAQSALSQWNADRNYTLQSAGLTGYLNGAPTLDRQQYYSGLATQAYQQAYEQSRTAYENALTRWKTYGYVLPADAALLGVPSGTSTADERYQSATLKLNQMKTYYQISQ